MALNSELLTETQFLRKISAFLTVVVIAVVFAFCYFASSFFLTIILASFLAILIDPIINLAERWKINRSISSALVVVIVMISLGAGVYWSYTRLSDLPESLPTYTSALKRVIRPLNQKIEKVQESAGSLTTPDGKQKRIEEVTIKQSPTWPTYLMQGVGSASSMLISIGVLPFMVFFLLVGKERAYDTFQSWLGERIDVPQFSHRLTTMVRGFTIGNLVVGGIVCRHRRCVVSRSSAGRSGHRHFERFSESDPFPWTDFCFFAARGGRTVGIFHRGSLRRHPCNDCHTPRHFFQFSDPQNHWFPREYWSRRGNPGSFILGMAVGCNGTVPGDPIDCFRQTDFGLLSAHDLSF